MHCFKDTEGREWVVQIHVAAIKECRGSLGIDLYKLVDDGFKGLSGLLGDPVTLVDVLFVLCRAQAEKRGVTDEDFGRAMSGDVLASAAEAFLSEYTDFFPNPRLRAGLKKVMAKCREVQDRTMDLLERSIERFEASTSNGPSGTSPAPSGSTPDPSRSANST